MRSGRFVDVDLLIVTQPHRLRQQPVPAISRAVKAASSHPWGNLRAAHTDAFQVRLKARTSHWHLAIFVGSHSGYRDLKHACSVCLLSAEADQ
jgi:hypothetical protein